MTSDAKLNAIKILRIILTLAKSGYEAKYKMITMQNKTRELHKKQALQLRSKNNLVSVKSVCFFLVVFCC